MVQPPVVFRIAVLPHGADPQFLPGLGIAVEEHPAALHDPLPELLGRLVEQDHVHATFRSQVGESDREIRLKVPPGAGVGGVWQDGDVEVAVRTRSPLSARAEDHQDGDAGQVTGGLQDLVVEGGHAEIVAKSPAAVVIPLVKEFEVMATLSLRLPDSLHRQLKDLAEKEKVSINQLISTAVAEKISALMTVDYLEALAREGSREAFEAVFAKVPDVEPDLWDRWTSPDEDR
jgi:predicted transcriptional regulator